MKKIFTLIAVAAMAISANAQESVIVSYADGNANKIDLTEGFVMQCTGNEEKKLSGAKKLTIDGNQYTSIKISNGAEHTVWLPTGKVAASVTFYSYVNKSTSDEPRNNYWADVNGTAYEYGETSGGKMQKFTDVDDYMTNPDVSPEFPLGNVTSFTFKNAGYQPCLVMKIVYGEADAINEIKHVNISNGAIYNLGGQQVTEAYKGVVIKNGKKVVLK